MKMIIITSLEAKKAKTNSDSEYYHRTIQNLQRKDLHKSKEKKKKHDKASKNQ